MHTSSLLRMKWFVDTFLINSKPKMRVLDVGSCDVNSSYKQYFPSHTYDYIDLDMSPGPNVDIVPQAPYAWKEINDASFDVVISGQAFEHMEFFWVTMSEIVRVTKPAGLICIIAPRGFGRHRYPVDCYRFDADGLIALARYTQIKLLHVSTNLAPDGVPLELWCSDYHADSMLVAMKPVGWKGQLELATYTCTPADLDTLAQPMVFSGQKSS